MDVKTLLIVVGLVAVLYLQGCFGGVHGQEQPAPALDSADCYTQINDQVRDLWPQMSRAERFAAGMRAISLCEGGNE